MAERLARLYGTEQDHVNCAFFAKMGACRYGLRCQKNHHRPGFSPCVQIDHMYKNPVAVAAGSDVTIPPDVLQQHFEEFYEDLYTEFGNFGRVEQMNIMGNLGDHLVGNVYCLFEDEEAAAKALAALNGRYYAGEPIVAELSPVTDFHEARCRAYDESQCARGGQCNFMHILRPSEKLAKRLGIARTVNQRSGNRRSWSPASKRHVTPEDRAKAAQAEQAARSRDSRRDSRRDRDRSRSRSRRRDSRRDSRRDGDSRRSERRSERREEGGGAPASEAPAPAENADEGLLQF